MADDFTKEFLYFFTHNSSLSHEQLVKRDKLLYRDLMSNSARKTIAKKNKKLELYDPQETKKFLSLFNEPSGLKYLTHDFDSYDDSIMSLDVLSKNCQEILAGYKDKIPKSLYFLINAYLTGNQYWIDVYNNRHKSSMLNKEWIAWTKDNNKHPILNQDFEVEIQAFRHTIRLVPPQLEDMIHMLQSKFSKLNVETRKLDKASFYTNTFTLNSVLYKIFQQISRRSDQGANVMIEYKRIIQGDVIMGQLYLTHRDSYPHNELEPLIKRLKENPSAGDFGAIKNILNGYCYWSVITKWDEKCIKWNLLRDEDTPEIEEVNPEKVSGFTHVFTYYFV